MKKLLVSLMLCLCFGSAAGDYSATTVVQTGLLRESDLIVRNITDLVSKKTCLSFYIRTAGTSPVTKCYDATAGFGTTISQVGHIKENDLIIRKLEDVKNGVACLTAYVSTPGTSPAVDCFSTKVHFKESLTQDGHLREGDLDVRKIVDTGSQKACLITYVATAGTSPSIVCYDSQTEKQGSLRQVSHLREGDLVVRKIMDTANRKACMATYVSTEGTSSNLYCYDE